MPDLLERRTAEGLLWLESGTISAPGGAAHGFSTRLGGVSQGVYAALNLGHTRGDDPQAVRENYRRFCRATGVGEENLPRLVLSHQVHGDGLRVCTLADAGKGLDRPRDYEADGLMTDIPDLPLVIFSADCIPILLYDPVRRVVACCHGGWRGTAQAIAAKTVARMGEVYGCRPGDIRGAIGPGISACCFQTDEDVPWAMREALGGEAEPYCRPNGQPGRYQVDLKGLNAHILRRAGVEQIDCASDCTACRPERYWSHRLTGPARGSMAAVIMLKQR